MSTASNPSSVPPTDHDPGRSWVLVVAVVGWVLVTAVAVMLATGFPG